MKAVLKWAIWGAVLGFLAVTLFAVGEMLGSPESERPPTAIVVVLAMAMGGLLVGVPTGGTLGGIIGMLVRAFKGRRKSGAPRAQTDHAPLSYNPAEHTSTAQTPNGQAPYAATAPAPLAPIAPAPERAQRPERVDLSDPQRLNHVLSQLDALVGLESVAEQVRAVANRVAFEVHRASALGVERSEIGMHALFLGPPGVGKTEVARIWGEVLCSLGLLPTDQVVEVSRQDLVAPHIGETAGRTRKRLEEARGGVFFLDEAYALAPRTPQDFGPEAVAELLAYMENHRDSLCVIAAGYEDETREFLDVNPGLSSRFSETISFPAYDAPTLVEITSRMAAQQQDRFTPDGLDLLRRGYTRLVASPPQGWANARSARQMLDAVRTARAARAGAGVLDHAAMTTLTGEDVRAALQRKYPQAV